MARYDTTWLIDSVKRIESIPVSQTTFADSDILELMNMELTGALVPLLLEVREEYFLTYTDFVGPAASLIQIPGHASGLKLRAVHDLTNGAPIQLTRLNLDEIAANGTSIVGAGLFPGIGLNGYLVENDNIRLYPPGSDTRTIRVYHYRQPSTLVTSLEGTTVTAKSGGNTIQVAYLPTAFTTAQTFDCTSKDPVFKRSVAGFTVSATTQLSMTLDSVDDYNAINVGDSITLSEQAIYAQYLPLPAHNLLIQGTGMRCLEALGDRAGWTAAAAKYEMIKRDLLTIISPRDEASHKKIVKGSKFRNVRYF